MTATFPDYSLQIGDCRELLAALPDNCIDSCVTDPPYELGFMGKGWDKSGIANDPVLWREVLRVLKPGGYLLAFSGTRTYHRMVCAIEDAGFEIRDQLGWMYGSGFPKSQNVSKFIDKQLGAQGSFGAPKSEAHAGWIDRGAMRGGAGNEGWQRPWMQDVEAVDNAARQYIAGSTEAAAFQGWGTALKPAWEPICMARKPLAEKTVAANVLTHGTGAINIDGCRVPTDETITNHSRGGEAAKSKGKYGDSKAQETHQTEGQALGRFPANLIHDGSDEVLDIFPSAPGQIAEESTRERSRTKNVYGDMRGRKGEPSADSDNKGVVGFRMKPGARRIDSGSAARFFYCAKTSKADRGEGNDHPTVKPTDLMRYLCRLVTPVGGLVLDPFTGSGSTGRGALLEGFRFIGIEQDASYVEIAEQRLKDAYVEAGRDLL